MQQFAVIKKLLLSINGLTVVTGTVFQWFDFALFSTVSGKLAQNFFPATLPHTYAVMMVWIFFAAGWVLSPLGGMIFGYIGDQFSRKTALRISIMLMSLASISIAILPSYEKIGVFASVILALTRMLQGLSSNAEYNGATIYLIEKVPTQYKPLFGCLPNISNSAGMILGFFAGTLFTSQIMPDWCWRIPFVLAFMGLICSYRLRKRILPTRWTRKKIITKTNMLKLLKNSPIPITLAAYNGVTSWGIYVWGASLLRYYGLTTPQASSVILIALIVDIILEPITGVFAIKLDNKKIFLGWTTLLIFSFYPLITLIKYGNFYLDLACMILITILLSPPTAMINSIVTETFAEKYRYFGMGTFWNIGMTVFGGTTPIVLSFILHQSKSLNLEYIAAYIILFLLIALITVWFYGKKKIFKGNRRILAY